MLRQSFIVAPGIGPVTERRLWSEGVRDWDDLLANWKQLSFGSADRSAVVRGIERASEALAIGEHQFFARRLKIAESWRCFPEFRDKCVYLDIETDGGSDVTMIGLYDGISYVCLTKHDDLGSFPDLISHYSMIVTFAGAMFDLPQLQRQFGGLRFDQIHVDLVQPFRRLGVRGGLKKIEKDLGIERSEAIEGLSGYDAVRLWRRYRQLGDDGALERLVEYNRADTVNLERLAEESYARLRNELVPMS